MASPFKFAKHAGQLRLGIPGVHLRRRALSEDLDHMLCLGGKMSRFCLRAESCERLFGKQACQSERTKTHTAL